MRLLLLWIGLLVTLHTLCLYIYINDWTILEYTKCSKQVSSKTIIYIYQKNELNWESTAVRNLKTIYSCRNNADIQGKTPVYWFKPTKQFQNKNWNLNVRKKDTEGETLVLQKYQVGSAIKHHTEIVKMYVHGVKR